MTAIENKLRKEIQKETNKLYQAAQVIRAEVLSEHKLAEQGRILDSSHEAIREAEHKLHIIQTARSQEALGIND